MTMMKRVLSVVGLGCWLMSGCGAPDGALEDEGAPAETSALSTSRVSAPAQATGGTALGEAAVSTEPEPGGADCPACPANDHAVVWCCFNLPVYDDPYGGPRNVQRCYTKHCSADGSSSLSPR
jgi:hypothetical protein